MLPKRMLLTKRALSVQHHPWRPATRAAPPPKPHAQCEGRCSHSSAPTRRPPSHPAAHRLHSRTVAHPLPTNSQRDHRYTMFAASLCAGIFELNQTAYTGFVLRQSVVHFVQHIWISARDITQNKTHVNAAPADCNTQSTTHTCRSGLQRSNPTSTWPSASALPPYPIWAQSTSRLHSSLTRTIRVDRRERGAVGARPSNQEAEVSVHRM